MPDERYSPSLLILAESIVELLTAWDIEGSVLFELPTGKEWLFEFSSYRWQGKEAAVLVLLNAYNQAVRQSVRANLDVIAELIVVNADIVSGRGLAVIDPHGDFSETLLEYVPSSRTEDVLYFNLADKHGVTLLTEGNREKNRDFLKKIGSNFQVANQSLALTFRTPWQFVADFNSQSVSAFADNDFSNEKQKWRRGRDSNPR